MPAEGLNWMPRKEILSYEELVRICTLLVNMGIKKIRITGGEPFVRKGMINFIEQLIGLERLEEVNITTNGVLTAPLVPALKKIGVHSLNLSLDTLDRKRFQAITRRDELPAVLDTLETALQSGMPVKINAVVMDKKNTDDILSLAALTKENALSVRFIEEMPFNGASNGLKGISWDYRRILARIREHYPGLQKMADPHASTSLNFQVPGHKGTIGVIPAYTRSFCGSCNRIRLTPEGELKTCLYGKGVVNLKDKIREGLPDELLKTALMKAFQSRTKDGWEAERQQGNVLHPSMAKIGG